MGCINSNLRTTHSPATYSPEHAQEPRTSPASAQEPRTTHHDAQSVGAYSPPRSSGESDHIPPNAQHVSGAVIASNAQWQAYHALGELLNKSNTLCQQIGEERVNLGDSLRAIHESAIKLRNDLHKRTDYIEGNSPHRYQERFNDIQQDFNAILSVTSGSNPGRFFDHALSFQIGSSATRSNAPE